MTDGVSAAYRDNISVTDLIPKRIWILARDIVIDDISSFLSNMLKNPDSIKRAIKYTYNIELTDQELRFLTYALYHIKQHLMSVIQ